MSPVTDLIVLILGGTTTVARTLALYLLQDEQNHVKFVRIADRFSVRPASTYLDKPFLAILDNENSSLEYKQVNLANAEKHTEVFYPPSTWRGKETSWKRFDVVFDLTGDTASDKPELIQISNTYQLALSLAKSASTLQDGIKPKAYVRLTFPFYEMKSLGSSSTGHAESADLRPDGVRGRWWHETLRGIGQIQGLNVAVIRCGAWYGRGTWEGEVLPRVVAGHVYKYLKEEMKFLYNNDLRIHTVHTFDIAQALYLLAVYLLDTPRETVITQTGVEVRYSFTTPPSNTFSIGSKRASISETYKTVKTVVPEKEKIILPIFNVVDDNDSTQEKLAKAVADVWEVKFGFLSSTVALLVQQFAKTDFVEMVEDVNEKHVEAWSQMLAESRPPITSSPISPFLDEHAFKKHAICLDGAKARRILGFKPTKPYVEVSELKKIVEEFQQDGIWYMIGQSSRRGLNDTDAQYEVN